MQPQPTAAEFLATIADLLEREFLPALPAELQHKARVAANVCRVIRREQQLSPDAERRERELVSRLLGHDGDPATLNADLAVRLRAGDDPGFERAAWEVLVAVARDDLAIAKPGHDTWEGV